MRFCHGLLIATVLAITGCTQAVKIPPPPKIVKVTVTKYVPVPAEFTKPCPVALPQDKTVREAVRIARARRASLDQCNWQLDKIRNLTPPADAESTSTH